MKANEKQFSENLRKSMRASAASVSIISTCDGSRNSHGMAVTSAVSLSMEPPSMMVAINQSASSYKAFIESGKFCLNLLHEKQLDVLDAFSSSAKRHLRFAGCDWKTSEDGIPYLDSSISNLFCRIDESHTYGTHTVLFGKIEKILVSDNLSDKSPLIWINGGTGTFCSNPAAIKSSI
jgi:flavin reductase (DIM6/NTAB) family NADH-FMN oxidoreductase RutF